MEWQDLKQALNREIASSAKNFKPHVYELFSQAYSARALALLGFFVFNLF